MAVPKKRTSKSRKNIRRKNHKLKPKILKACKKCGKLIKAHIICPHCGNYNK